MDTKGRWEGEAFKRHSWINTLQSIERIESLVECEETTAALVILIEVLGLILDKMEE